MNDTKSKKEAYKATYKRLATDEETQLIDEEGLDDFVHQIKETEK